MKGCYMVFKRQWYIYMAIAVVLACVIAAVLSTANTRGSSHAASIPASAPASTSNDFVTVNSAGTGLQLQGQPYRFAGPNIYWLGSGTAQSGVDYQTQVNDILQVASQSMSGTVVRSHELGISSGCGDDSCVEPSLGDFPSIGFSKLDYAISQAGKDHLRLVIPFVDNWDYGPGGITTWTNWVGDPNASDFYTNPTIIQDFETYIGTILNHKNALTGVLYKDDPTILAWEEGNELNDAPASWISTIATYIKSQDANHLVAFGSQMGLARNNALSVKNVDIIDAHYYPMNVASMISDAKTTYQAGKVYYIGEYGWNQGDLPSYLSSIEANNPDQGYLVSGDTYWDLFPAGVAHQDSSTEDFTLHYPGDDASMSQSVAELTNHAKAMSADNATASTGTVLTSSASPTSTVPPTVTVTPTDTPSATATVSASSAAPIGKTIWLKSAQNGLYVSAWSAETNTPLEARSASVAAWEEFDVVDAGAGSIALKLHGSDTYVSAWSQDQNTPLEARVTHLENWETFKWVAAGNGTIALIANVNGDYVSAWVQDQNAPLEARVNHLEQWETFQWGVVA
jgi:mannan endo-1,4-beta-mannosidase